jgi:hypothetical protein
MREDIISAEDNEICGVPRFSCQPGEPLVDYVTLECQEMMEISSTFSWMCIRAYSLPPHHIVMGIGTISNMQ